jgi:hypothetical protein
LGDYLMAIVINGSTGITATESSNLLGNGVVEAADLASGAAASNLGFTPASASDIMGRNRIINGDMRIDQRNAGASVSIPSTATYTLDRYGTVASQSSKFSVQQNAGSVTPPAGFSNYLGVTSSSAYSVPSNEIFCVYQNIEGFNFADLNWGTANAKTITISFWVRSSLTGTFGGSIANNAFDRSYPYSYTISSANTWEYKTVTIAGDTTGTWVGATNGIGLRVYFPVGVGSDYSGTAGAWTGSGKISATAAVSVVGTSGATFYITGVQLEVGSVATEFERRPYGTELFLCQRYYEELVYPSATDGYICNGGSWASTQGEGILRFAVQKRATPTMGYTSTIRIREMGQSVISGLTPLFDTPSVFSVLLYSDSASGLTVGRVVRILAGSTSTRINASAEL